MRSIRSAKECVLRNFEDIESNFTDNVETQCPLAWDGFLCWGPAQAGATVNSSCPDINGLDITKTASRTCSASGKWLNKDGVPSQLGWTNYTLCFTPEIREVLRKLGSTEDAQVKMNIAENTRILELIGLSTSLVTLLISLVFFFWLKKVRTSSTRLHRHLFFAMLLQVAIRLIIYTDQALTRLQEYATSSDNQRRGIDNTPALCKASYICLEYARTAMFMWMFAEGIYLHNRIAGTVFEGKLSPRVYPIVGWILPIPFTICWTIFTHINYGQTTCWWGYSFTKYFWILEGPRLAVLLVNLGFLLNILRVLVQKLKQSNSSEMLQAMKAVKAALTLLPLFGLTNILSMIATPLESSPFVFACWSYSTHVLTSTQGLMLSILYCFRNEEIQLALCSIIRRRSTRFCSERDSTQLFDVSSGGLHRQGAVIRRDYHYDHKTLHSTTYI